MSDINEESLYKLEIQDEMNSCAIDYVSALKRPFKETRKLAIGVLLGSIPIVNFTAIGYTMVSTGLTDEKVSKDNLPEWSNYVDLFKKGLVAVLIGITLSLPAAIVLLGTVGSVIFSPAMEVIFGSLSLETYNDLMRGQISDAQMHHWLTQNWTELIPLLTNAAPFIILAVLLALLALYVMPFAIMGWLKEDKISAAFSWSNLKKTVTLDYIVNWLIVGYLIGIVNSLLDWIPLLGMGITMYIGGVFSYSVYSTLYNRAHCEVIQ